MKYWIVIEWNQASGQPRAVDNGELFWTKGEAESVALAERESTTKVGRCEEYTVHEIELDRYR
ncbi:hypothetical protein DC31_13770 [Microbacterium sp. CH12i]|uniref:hypothetical protein n=1 Tax=Microbacterium sp. CH12i TaxID=1479651 RepID=UPI000460EE48|nr:hypothetical protein [Microbacterium sp. CH12i]KDA05848.1 hypothetical protein DC31_13770 [Microbacterium sp. CH12i]